MTRVLITGGAGFIGSHTADALKAKRYKVRILDCLLKPVHTDRWPTYVRGRGFELLKGDVRNKKDWVKALTGADYVFHLAAYQDQLPDYSTFFHINTVGTALMYEVIAEKKFPVKKIVLASSQFAYGDGKYQCRHSGKLFYPELRPPQQRRKAIWPILCKHGKPAKFFPFREDQPVAPTNAYGLSKMALEELGLCFGKTHGIPTVALRYSIVQGPRQSPRNVYSGALRIFVTRALAQEPLTVYEDGKQLRDFVNVADVVAANLFAMKNKKADYQVFNVGGGRGYRILDFAKMVKRITGSPSPIVIGGFRKTDTRHAVSDISKLRKLGWRPRYRPEKAVRDYVEWIQAERFDLGFVRRAKKKLKHLGVVSS
jgi:dTDP-L-rhamnose 4-epimerase